MKVLMITLHPLVPGGVSHYIELLKSSFSPTVETTTVLIGRRPNEDGALHTIFRLFGDTLRVVERALFGRFDIIHLNTSLREKCVLRDGVILFILRLCRVRGLLIFIHGWRPSLEKRIWSNPLYRRVLRFLIGPNSCVIVLAEPFKKALVALGISPGHIIVSRTMFDGKALQVIRENNDQTANGRSKRIILFLSRFEREKGVCELLEAFARIRHKFPSAELILAGGGPAHEELRHLVEALGLSDRVRLLSYQRGTAKTDLLRKAWIFALPTYYGEGMPVALLEAMAAGKPVLTARVGGIPSVISDPENGVLLDEISIDSVEAGLIRMLDDDAYCVLVGKENAERAWKHFEAGIVTMEMEQLYSRLAAGDWHIGSGPLNHSHKARL